MEFLVKVLQVILLKHNTFYWIFFLLLHLSCCSIILILLLLFKIIIGRFLKIVLKQQSMRVCRDVNIKWRNYQNSAKPLKHKKAQSP